MKVSYSWLKEFVDIHLQPQELADRLTMAGLEVEEITPLAPGFSGVVVGQVLKIERHPNADRLSLCEVKTDKGLHTIVCGAKNMKPMDKVALALPGAALPEGGRIERVEIRGVRSDGMMCSPKELGLGDDESGILILPEDTELGLDLSDAFNLKDTILEIGITPNRPDCLSIIGIAREVAALTGTRLKSPEPTVSKLTPEPVDDQITIEIKAPSLCPRYTAKIVKGVEIKPSPFWMSYRLESLDIRSINNVVDITNYVLLERGQPLHAFDYHTISDRKIIIRTAEDGEKVSTLDGVERELNRDMLVIADIDKVLAIAGVMGGLNSEVSEGTTTVLLESAYFNPSSIRRTSRELNLSTESSYRFERGVDPEDNITEAIERAARLMVRYAGAKVVSDTIDVCKTKTSSAPIRFRPSRVNAVLGTDIKEKEMVSILKGLGIETGKDDGSFTAKPPSFRIDLKEEIDIIEEIARVRGYSEIAETLPRITTSPVRLSRGELLERRIRDYLIDSGFFEVMNYSFLSPVILEALGFEKERLIPIMNPLTQEQSVMRPSLIPSLVENMRYNLSYKNTDLTIFEIGKVFYRDVEGGGMVEHKRLAGLATGSRWKGLWCMDREDVDHFDIKGVLEGILTLMDIDIEEVDYHPLNTCRYMDSDGSYTIGIRDRELGMIGEIDIDTLEALEIEQPAIVFDMDLDALIEISGQRRKRFRPLPRLPSVERDISIILDDSITAKRVKEVILSVDDENIRDVRIFDLYRGKEIPEGRKSIALRITYLSTEKTLTEDEVNAIHSRVIDRLKEELDARLR